MPLQMPITIAQALRGIQIHDYVLPLSSVSLSGIPDKWPDSFDSLLRGYPIGSFLFWKVGSDNADAFRFYGLILTITSSRHRTARFSISLQARLWLPFERTAAAHHT
jgi:hypothetical protein